MRPMAQIKTNDYSGKEFRDRLMASGKQRPVQRFPTASIRLLKHGGIVSVKNSADWIRHWRYPNDVMLAVSWPTFFGLVAAAYLLLNLTFSCLYWLDRHGIAGAAVQSTRFDDAFFFSVQTLGSIGYGALYPSSLYTNVIVTIESLMGIVFIALITGLAFRRFSRSTARILFSEVATMHDYDGQHSLMFRLANERSRTILQARIQAYLAIDERTVEGHRMRRLYPLRLQREHSPLFLLTWTAMHSIDSTSPLHGLTLDDLAANHADIVVSFSGIDEILDRPIHAHHNYPISKVLFDQAFVEMMRDEEDGSESMIVANFNRTHHCPSNTRT